jgi:DivIVA domain-containing protein
MEAAQGDASPRRVSPADVHNIAFTRPPIGKRGYHEQEVDDFLDIVEQELARLIEYNEQLKAGSGADPAAVAAATDQAVSEERTRMQTELDAVRQRYAELENNHNDLQRQHYDLQQAQAQLQAAHDQGATTSAEHHQQAVKVLALAQATADQHLAEAQAEAERMRMEAQVESDRLRHESTSHAERQLTDAQTRAEQLTQESSTHATKVVQDAEQRAAAMNEAMESRRGALQKHVDELRTFEREYRTRLKSYLESQLRDLERGGHPEQGNNPGQ